MFGKKHLDERNESYIQHGVFAFKYGFVLLWAGVTSLIHGVCPSIFKYHSAQTVIRIYNIIQRRERKGEHE